MLLTFSDWGTGSKSWESESNDWEVGSENWEVGSNDWETRSNNREAGSQDWKHGSNDWREGSKDPGPFFFSEIREEEEVGVGEEEVEAEDGGYPRDERGGKEQS